MNTIGIIAQKGGTGKTTVAINLAVAAEKLGLSTLIVDLDEQGSAKAWSLHRSREGYGDSPAVISAHAVQLPKIIAQAEKNGADLVIFDTAPHSKKDAFEAAKHCDLLVVPCKPGFFDVSAVRFSAEIAELANKRAIAVPNEIPSRGSLGAETVEVLEALGFEVSPVQLGSRVAFKHSVADGLAALEYESSGKAAKESKALFKFLIDRLKQKDADNREVNAA